MNNSIQETFSSLLQQLNHLIHSNWADSLSKQGLQEEAIEVRNYSELKNYSDIDKFSAFIRSPGRFSLPVKHHDGETRQVAAKGLYPMFGLVMVLTNLHFLMEAPDFSKHLGITFRREMETWSRTIRRFEREMEFEYD